VPSAPRGQRAKRAARPRSKPRQRQWGAGAGRYADPISSSSSEPTALDPGAPRRSRRTPPLWLQWLASLLVAIAAIVLLVRFVDANSTPSAQAPHVTPKGSRSLEQEAAVLDAQEQAPHVVTYAAATATPREAITRAVAGYIDRQIGLGRLPGPVEVSVCFAVPGGRAPDLAFRCSVLARRTSYPFEGVVDPALQRVTYCRHNPPPAPGRTVPISRRCQA
jgi:hypothetical protein